MSLTNVAGISATSFNIGTLLNESDSKAAGTAYTLTNTAAALDFGTTDPAITLDEPGTYLIMARADVNYTAATFAAVRDMTLKLRRTNNTAGDVTNGSVVIKTNIITLLTYTFTNCSWWAIYTTANSNDIITIFGDISTVPTAGSLDVVGAALVAIKIGV